MNENWTQTDATVDVDVGPISSSNTSGNSQKPCLIETSVASIE